MLRLKTAFPLEMQTFNEVVAATPFVVVRVGNRVIVDLPKELVDYVAAEHPRNVTLAYMRRKPGIPRPWWQKHFGQSDPADGYYLFHRGKRFAYTDGNAAVADNEAMTEFAVAGLGLMFGSNATVSAVANRLRRRDVDATIAWLEERIAAVKTQARPSAGSKPNPEPQRPPAPPPKPDPHAVLGVSPTASFAEKKKAHREAVTKNHPDKVAHMSPEVQKFAEERTKLLNLAFEEIEKMEG